MSFALKLVFCACSQALEDFPVGAPFIPHFDYIVKSHTSHYKCTYRPTRACAHESALGYIHGRILDVQWRLYVQSRDLQSSSNWRVPGTSIRTYACVRTTGTLLPKTHETSKCTRPELFTRVCEGHAQSD